ncbi:MAG: hypothetical protein A3C55_06795 [Gammaproteobacteria bacterium RIFCSPHIGHO2_02_FULL_42_13]|nr:MAG: hypothetical protein A3C55_06795 [Gammaproteobacteria bacterium RIFCSPHIGHO2_02_FULL_42_13]OGT69011.1 MAG: hypothetical protein A3H43_06485 [Gammaproteobacteria bacterium RIFCSPLOWO2_02_FULL_42_9]HLB57472.1 primosomal protein N' [Gammaproteobacteria bacterium]
MTKLLSIALNKHVYTAFDYQLDSNETILPGMRVTVPFRNKTSVGIILEEKQSTSIALHKLKKIISIVDSEPLLTPELLTLCLWAADYYHYPIGEVLFHALPIKLRRQPTKTRKKKDAAQTQTTLTKKIKLNATQANAVQAITTAFDHFQCFLLHGVTGSGKTEVYLQTIEQLLKQDKQALILVPEIALTPQMIERFNSRFEQRIATIHSGLNPTERLDAWQKAKSDEAKIIIGTRSAIFTPFKKLGLIIIDEEHDSSFKQQDGFRYSARDLAITRAYFENIPIMLGSATPSLETLKNAKENKYVTLSLPERVGNAIHPSYHLIDTRGQYLENGLSRTLIDRISMHLQQGNQVLIFLNRRGFSPILQCHACGFIATCERCEASMTFHQTKTKTYLQCHHCETKLQIMPQCPHCNATELTPIGAGTERLETALQQHFPAIPIVRIDRDSTERKESLNDMLEQIQQGHRQILVGTQILAKGHHFPNVTLVGVINADNGFFSNDFRATEKLGQLLTQVAGRAGRAEKPGEVYIQTHHPEHPLLKTLIETNYNDFAQSLLIERVESNLPPYSYFALVHAKSFDMKKPELFLKKLKQLAMPFVSEQIKIQGPVLSPITKRQGYYRAQLLLQSNHRSALHQTLTKLIEQINQMKSANTVKWALDIDPVEIY